MFLLIGGMAKCVSSVMSVVCEGYHLECLDGSYLFLVLLHLLTKKSIKMRSKADANAQEM